MGNWGWVGVDAKGRKQTGKIPASTKKEARRLLRARGIRPQTINPPSWLEFDIGEWMVEQGIARPFSQEELTYFTKQLATMINAGIPILQSLEILYKEEKSPSLRAVGKSIANLVAEGKTLAEAMSKQRGFSKLYCNLVKAGEAGGVLDEILNKLAEHMEKQQATKRQVKSAMMYPAIVTLVGIGVIYAMMLFVVPQFVDMLKQSNQEVPWITQFVIDLSEFLSNYTVVIVPSFGGAAVALKLFIGTPVGKELFDRFMMQVPLFGGIVIKGNLSNFSRILATMMSSGVSLVDALEICAETTDNNVIANDIMKIRKAVTEGRTLTDPLIKIKYFPNMVAQLVKVGEQTGNVDVMLTKVAKVFDEELAHLISGMTKLIEPLIIVVLGIAIAGILVAMYLPIFMSAGGS